MTTKTELAEILLESDRTGRKVQERNVVNDTNWYYYDGNGFMLNEYEYRLEPKKKVKHGGWFDPKHLEEIKEKKPYPNLVRVTWETEE